jgi:hypothetical protein
MGIKFYPLPTANAVSLPMVMGRAGVGILKNNNSQG